MVFNIREKHLDFEVDYEYLHLAILWWTQKDTFVILFTVLEVFFKNVLFL